MLTLDQDMAVEEAPNIPLACRAYLSHHIRNELMVILGTAEHRISGSPETVKAIKESAGNIIKEMDRLGL